MLGESTKTSETAPTGRRFRRRGGARLSLEVSILLHLVVMAIGLHLGLGRIASGPPQRPLLETTTVEIVTPEQPLEVERLVAHPARIEPDPGTTKLHEHLPAEPVEQTPIEAWDVPIRRSIREDDSARHAPRDSAFRIRLERPRKTLPVKEPSAEKNEVAEPEPAAEPPSRPEPAKALVAVKAPKPKYPSFARRRGHQGRVVIGVRVSAAGTVDKAWIARSSGHESLDHAALSAVREWTFKTGTPARSGTVPVRFVLK